MDITKPNKEPANAAASCPIIVKQALTNFKNFCSKIILIKKPSLYQIKAKELFSKIYNYPEILKYNKN